VTSIAFDSTALIHFARAGRLNELLAASADDEPVLLAGVAEELARGVGTRPSLDAASEAKLKRVDLAEIAELAAFASYKSELGGGPERNNGEAAVLAWVNVHSGLAIIDEDVARNLGKEDGMQVHGSLWLLIRSFKNGILDRATIEGVVNDLLRTGMRLPVTHGADLFPWASRASLLP
jgi:predicted nucleic acid-binding protein